MRCLHFNQSLTTCPWTWFLPKTWHPPPHSRGRLKTLTLGPGFRGLVWPAGGSSTGFSLPPPPLRGHWLVSAPELPAQLSPGGSAAEPVAARPFWELWFSTRPCLEPPLSFRGDWPLEWVAADGTQAPSDFHSQQELGAPYFPSYLLASGNRKTSKPSCQPRGTGWGGLSVWSAIIAGGCVLCPLWGSISWCYQYLTTEQGAKAGLLQPLLSHSEGHGLMWYPHRKL